MKQIALLAVGLMVAGSCLAGPSEAVATYFTNNVVTTAAFTNAGDTGLSVSNAYLCFLVSELGDLTATQATGSLAAVMYEIEAYLYDRIQSLTSTNQPEYIILSEQIEYNTSGTTQTVYQSQTVKRAITGTYTYPAE